MIDITTLSSGRGRLGLGSPPYLSGAFARFGLNHCANLSQLVVQISDLVVQASDIRAGGEVHQMPCAPRSAFQYARHS
jgi:hypothetical protein